MKRTKIANEDDEEAAVLIEKLAKWHRLLTMLQIICIVMFIVVVDVGYDVSDLEFFIFCGVLATINILYFKKLLFPFCHKYLYWPYRSGMWRYAFSSFIRLKKCPQCSRSLRVKKKERARKGPFELGESN